MLNVAAVRAGVARAGGPTAMGKTAASPGGCRGPFGGLPTRRGAVRAGMLAMTGLGLPDLFRGRAAADRAASAPGFGRARSCILIFQWGGPSQLDTWDPKPEAPAEIRGEFA